MVLFTPQYYSVATLLYLAFFLHSTVHVHPYICLQLLIKLIYYTVHECTCTCTCRYFNGGSVSLSVGMIIDHLDTCGFQLCTTWHL